MSAAKGPFVLRYWSKVPDGLSDSDERVARYYVETMGYAGQYLLSTGSPTPKLERAKVFSTSAAAGRMGNSWVCDLVPVEVVLRQS